VHEREVIPNWKKNGEEFYEIRSKNIVFKVVIKYIIYNILNKNQNHKSNMFLFQKSSNKSSLPATFFSLPPFTAKSLPGCEGATQLESI
jgi:hypothetical protein